MPAEEERQFVSFERRTITSAKSAVQFGAIAAAAFGVLTILIVFSFDPPKNKHAEDLESSLSAEENLSSGTTTPDKPAPKATQPDPTPTEGATEGGTEGATEGGAEGATGTESGAAAPGATGAEAPAAGAAEKPAVEAPPPPKGATKAPPTALVGDKK